MGLQPPRRSRRPPSHRSHSAHLPALRGRGDHIRRAALAIRPDEPEGLCAHKAAGRTRRCDAHQSFATRMHLDMRQAGVHEPGATPSYTCYYVVNSGMHPAWSD
jgi:hypothetical protein